MNLTILKDKNLQAREKAIFKIFLMIMFFTHKRKYNNLKHVNLSLIFWLIMKYNIVFKNWWKKKNCGLKGKNLHVSLSMIIRWFLFLAFLSLGFLIKIILIIVNSESKLNCNFLKTIDLLFFPCYLIENVASDSKFCQLRNIFQEIFQHFQDIYFINCFWLYSRPFRYSWLIVYNLQILCAS